jgi:ankyrin repeat protein
MNFYCNPELGKSVAKNLIKKGININAKNKSEYTPMHLAIVNG